ncbi:unnamed protein product [Ranitomeya imitator]|uniref:Septin-type G domain-containing protein n=1 Tax=Ranitomeya imitator TaxID=111125 RepID=A0ABN9KMK7_9NEOB|nr:unnamed protein product [Ranitomeya imitator]
MDAIIIQELLAERLLSPRTLTQRTYPMKLKDQEKQYVGFATLPNQVHRKSVKKGFDFTLMVAGESGLGKSTLVNSLFLTDLYKDRKLLNAEERINQTVEILKHTVDIEEKGVKLKLTIVDTPGFGDAVNNTECWKAITDYIDQQFEQYFRDESGLNRKNIQDNRVHCCLYFISPFGHGLRPVDVAFMKALHEKVNIVPLIAKADCLVPIEIRKLKDRETDYLSLAAYAEELTTEIRFSSLQPIHSYTTVREEIEKFGIKVYQFPECDSDEDDDFKQQDKELKESVPFAVIGSNTVVEAKGQRVRGRLYPWGIVEDKTGAMDPFEGVRSPQTNNGRARGVSPPRILSRDVGFFFAGLEPDHPEICLRWEIPDVDLMATGSNTKVPSVSLLAAVAYTTVLCPPMNDSEKRILRADKVRLRQCHGKKTRRGRDLMKIGGAGPDCDTLRTWTAAGPPLVENQAHCDFVKLRNMLIRTHMHDLKDVTCDVHYENYRAQCIQQMTSKLTQDNRIESPIPILPLPTPDAETEKLIKMKDEECQRTGSTDVTFTEQRKKKSCSVDVEQLDCPQERSLTALSWRQIAIHMSVMRFFAALANCGDILSRVFEQNLLFKSMGP